VHTQPKRNIAAYEGWDDIARTTGQVDRPWFVIDPLGHCQDGAASYPRDTILGK
jgi:hypothetical protein